MKDLKAAALVTLGVAGPAGAAPLDLGHVPADVKWVAHLDGNALRSSPAMQAFVKHCLKAGKAGRPTDSSHSQPCAAISLDQLDSVTLYGTRLGLRNGVAIVQGKIDRDEFVRKLKAEKDVKAESRDGHTVYTWTKFKGTDCAHDVVLEFPKADVLVIASGPDMLSRAVGLLDGKGESLKGKQSPLTAEAPAGTVLLARAANLTDGDIGPHFTYFRLVTGFDYRFTDHDGQVTESLDVHARSKPVAEKLREVFLGSLALAALTFHGNDELMDILKDAKVEQNGPDVRTWYQASSDRLAKQIPQVCDTLREHWGSRAALMRQMLGDKSPDHDPNKEANQELKPSGQ